MDENPKPKKGFSGGLLFILLAAVLFIMVLQTMKTEKTANISFSYQLESLVNLDLLQPEDSAKVAINDNLVSFSGKFREEKSSLGKQRYRFLQTLFANHQLKDLKTNSLNELNRFQNDIRSNADWFLHLTGYQIPAGGYKIIDSTYDTPTRQNSIIITSLSSKNIFGLPQLRSEFTQVNKNINEASITHYGLSLGTVIANFQSPNLGIGSEEMKNNLRLMSRELEQTQNSDLAPRDKLQKYEGITQQLVALASSLNAMQGNMRLIQLRSVRNYNKQLTALGTTAEKLTQNQVQLNKARSGVGDTIWFFDNRELSTKQLEGEDVDKFSNWFTTSKEEWEGFEQNKTLTFKAPDQPLNTVLKKKFKSEEPATNYWNVFFSLLPFLILIALLYFFFSRQMKGIGGGAMNFGKSPAKLLTKDSVKVTFKDVAGIEEAKEELVEIVDFLKDPARFTMLGAQIPKGVLLIGPPGTGKTLIAKAVAGEADRPFFSIAGSDFVEMFVGVGASRIRDLFAQAKKTAPCIIFIDEIDAVGRHRGGGYGGGHDEREQTLNQLLVEMDGFDTNEGVIIIAATNRPDVLDRALLRPGRFDRRVNIELPDVRGRFEILKVHARNLKIDPSVDLMAIARGTPGASGADLKNILNEAALISARKGRKAVTAQDAISATDKVRFGKERRSLEITESDKKTTAYHESGHAVVGLVVKNADPVEKVTIIPRGMSLGATHFLPEKNRINYWKNELIDQLAVCMGGRVGEEIFVGDISSGAQQDIVQASEIARSMVCKWGMSEILGTISYEDSNQQQFGFPSTEKPFSEKTQEEIDAEVKNLVNAALNRAREIVQDNKAKVELMAERLMQFETLYKEDLDCIMETGELSEEGIRDRLDKEEFKFRKSPPPPPKDIGESDTGEAFNPT
ncbi:MAG: ATP-dependent zinc metalloprotease FtsH [Chlamydiae bacterium]|nr:ATP-dependent zinc metalloprotease FtsH [Chlamydiota bacterium]